MVRGWSRGSSQCGRDDCGLFTERWLIRPPFGRHTPRRRPAGGRAPAIRLSPAAARSDQHRGGGLCRWCPGLGRSIAHGEVRPRGVDVGTGGAGCGPGHVRCAAVTLTTPFPAIAVAPGLDAELRHHGHDRSEPGRVALTVGKVPDGWTAVLRGGGFTIDGVESDGTTRDQGHAQRDGPGRRRREHAADRRARHDRGRRRRR